MPIVPARPNVAATPPRESGGWLPLIAFVFVIISLIALAIIPGVLLSRVSKTANEISNTVLPANDALRDLAFALEDRVVSSRSRFLTDDPDYDARLAAAKRAEQEALHALADLAPQLGIATTPYLESLGRYMAVRDSLEQRIVYGTAQLEAYRAAIPRLDAIRDSMLIQLRALRMDVIRAAESRAADEARWAGLQRVLSVVLGAMALIAVLIVGWFAMRQRQLRRHVQSALHDVNRQRGIAERRGDELERAAKARVRLLRGVTHDVKNPLGAAKGYAELLQLGVRAPLQPEQVPLVDGVMRSIDGALAIIADLLDLARADSEGLAVHRHEVDLNKVVSEAAESHRPSAEGAGHTLDVPAPADALMIFTDPDRVTQVLGNLLSNAIKYTPAPGRITVLSSIRERMVSTGGEAWATVQVSDTGPGIPSDQREAIFDEFTRLEDAAPQNGHGLGLAIARSIARLLDGDLTVESAANGGANFILWLPLRNDDS